MKGIVFFIFFGIIPTVIAFALHPLMCGYGMNPICYIRCMLPVILCLPALSLDDEE